MAMLQQLVWKILPPLEVKLTIEEINSFLLAHANLAKSIVEKDATVLVKDAEKTIYSVRIEGMKPKHLALLLITNVTGKHLSMGNFHSYRGVLNTIGHEMLNLFSKALQVMLEHGYQTIEEAEKDMQWIRRQIANAG